MNLILSVKCRLYAAVLFLSFILGCGDDYIHHSNKYISNGQVVSHYGNEMPTSFDFLTFESGYQGAMVALKKEALLICLSGTTSSNDDKFRGWIEDSLNKWLAPLQKLTNDKLATPKIIEKSSGSECDMTFEIRSGVWGYTQITSPPQIVVGPNVPFGVVFHEFGHALGLRDTYQSGQSGNCQPRQPQSLMCNISFTEVQQDDIDGVTVVFNETFPNETPPIDKGETPDFTADIFLAIQEYSDEKVRLHLSASDYQTSNTGRPTGDLKVCIEAKNKQRCEDPKNWVNISKLPSHLSNDIHRFVYNQKLRLLDGDKVYAKYSRDGATTTPKIFTVNRKQLLGDL